MFGWEFPPHIAGGLGTACYGMTRGLAQHGVKVIFVMPKAYGDEDQQFVRVVNASDVETLYGDPKQKDIWEKMNLHPHQLEHGALYLAGRVRRLLRAGT